MISNSWIPSGDAELAFLQSVPLFSGVPDPDLQALLRKTRCLQYPIHSRIICEGDHGADLLVIRNGGVLVQITRDSEQVTLTQLGEGAYFGELALFDNYPRSASVVAASEVDVYMISANAFRACAAEHPNVLFQMCKVFSHRLRATNSILTRR
jgi:CRP/FNR family cyclic AMP-dependent transcriptional regulator